MATREEIEKKATSIALLHLRRCNAYNDCVTKRANEAFDRQFRRSLRGDK